MTRAPDPKIFGTRFNPVQPGTAGMKLAATGLLVVMAAIFIAARAFEPSYPWLTWVKAFAEAGMVGGLADWFAVTALFRHPLGLPIPHTAIIPRNKDRIGEALANFLKSNFLIAPVVARRMRHIDLAGAAGRFLQAPQGEETRIRSGASRLIADLFESLDDERLGGLVKSAISGRLRKAEVAPLLGHALASAINEDRHVPMLEATIRWTARALDANESLIREMVKKRTNWVLKLAGRRHEAVGFDHRRVEEADRRHADRPRAPGADADRAGAGRPRQRPADQARDPGQGRGTQAAVARQQVGRAVARHACGRRAARR